MDAFNFKKSLKINFCRLPLDKAKKTQKKVKAVNKNDKISDKQDI